MCAPLAAIVGFSLLLTWIFILYQPDSGPGITQRVGWQSWEIVGIPNTADSTSKNNSDSSVDLSTPEGVDWWNVTVAEDMTDSASLPLDVWSPLLPHDTGCMWNIISFLLLDQLKFI